MTPKQNALYWRAWSAARAAKPDSDRHSIHIAALGIDKSHLDFSNADFDAVLAHFYAISKPTDLDAQLDQQNQPLKRLVYACHELARQCAKDYPLIYLTRLINDKFQIGKIEDLNLVQLEQLRFTLAARLNSKRRARREYQKLSENCPF